jgi:hypothetical protein
VTRRLQFHPKRPVGVDRRADVARVRRKAEHPIGKRAGRHDDSARIVRSVGRTRSTRVSVSPTVNARDGIPGGAGKQAQEIRTFRQVAEGETAIAPTGRLEEIGKCQPGQDGLLLSVGRRRVDPSADAPAGRQGSR